MNQTRDKKQRDLARGQTLPHAPGLDILEGTMNPKYNPTVHYIEEAELREVDQGAPAELNRVSLIQMAKIARARMTDDDEVCLI